MELTKFELYEPTKSELLRQVVLQQVPVLLASTVFFLFNDLLTTLITIQLFGYLLTPLIYKRLFHKTKSFRSFFFSEF